MFYAFCRSASLRLQAPQMPSHIQHSGAPWSEILGYDLYVNQLSKNILDLPLGVSLCALSAVGSAWTVLDTWGIGNPWCQDGFSHGISKRADQKSSCHSLQMDIWIVSQLCVASGGASGNICSNIFFRMSGKQLLPHRILTAFCDSTEMTCYRTFDHTYHMGHSLCLCEFACVVKGFFYSWRFYHIQSTHIPLSFLFLYVVQCGELSVSIVHIESQCTMG